MLDVTALVYRKGISFYVFLWIENSRIW